ncbi:carbohydrate ABC transporter permease [Chloroflexi bacterium TSY]|nr:carbohydrate ABC transporter permease [Chloroflexi bacterium TSY]
MLQSTAEQFKRIESGPAPFIRRLLLYAALIVLAIITIVPFLWMLSTAFKAKSQVWIYPPQWIPNPWVFTNFTDALNAAPLLRYFFNSVIVSLGVVIERLLFVTLAAYAFARLAFPGRDILFILFLATVMIPGQVTLIPLYLISRSLGWLNTYHGMFLPSLASAFSIFWLRQFFLTIPGELEDAARIDGCSYFGILYRIFLPLSVPALAVLCLMAFEEGWNMFLWPLIITDSVEMRTIEVGLAYLRLALGAETAYDQITWLMAGTTMAVLPAIFVFTLVQRQMVQGIALTGLKG